MSDAACARTAEFLARLVPGDNRVLVPGDLICLYEVMGPSDSRETPIQLQTLQKTQLAYKLGLLLGRLLDQHRVRPFSWQRTDYCGMVEMSALKTCSVWECAAASDNRSNPLTSAQKSAQLVVVQQITSSGLLPKLATALSKLADIMQATEQQSPSHKTAALALLQLAVYLIAVWPGTGGVLTSAAASAIVVPAMRLAAAMVQHNIIAPGPRTEDPELALEYACRLVKHLGSMLLEERQRRARVPQALQGLSVVRSGLASPAFQQLALTVVALATDPTIVPAVFSRVHVDEEPRAAATEGQCAAVAASGAAQAPPAADTASRASISDVDSSSTVTDRTGSSNGDIDGVAARHMELCQQQQQMLLQMLYPALGSSSRWADFAAISAAALLRMGPTFSDFQYVTEAALACLNSVTEGATASSSSSTARGQASRTAAPAMSASSLAALPQLPVLLLQWAYVAASNPAAYLNRFAVYEAACAVSSDAFDCWESQLLSNRSHPSVSEDVSGRDQVPAARITELLLQNLRLLLQQQQALAARAVTSTPREAVDSYSSAAAEAPATMIGFDVMVGIGSLYELSQLMIRLKRFIDPAVWQPVSKELYSMLEWWLRVGSSSYEEQQQQQPQCSEAHSSSSAAYVALQWDDSPQYMQLYSDGKLSRAVWSYHHLIKTCEAWLNSTAAIYKADKRIISYDSVLLPCAAAAAPGSVERQQLLTLLISLLKKSSSTDGLLTLTPPDSAGKLTSGCELGCVLAAAVYMLKLCGPWGSSSSSGALQDSSSNQDTCTTTAGTTSSSSSAITSAGCNSNGSSAGMWQPAAAAPWMVVAARALINKTERLSGCLEYQPQVPDLHRVLQDIHHSLFEKPETAMLCPRGLTGAAAVDAFLAKIKQMFSDEALELVDYIQPFLHWTECVRPIICALEVALLGLTGRQGAASGSTAVIGPAVAGDGGSGSSTYAHSAAGPAAVGEVLMQTAAATPAVTVSSVQQAQLGSALQQLQLSFPKLQQLNDICSMLAPMPYVLRDVHPDQWLQKISKVGLAAEVVEALRTTSSIEAFRDALQLWGVQQFQQQLAEVGQLVCAALPLKYFCNNPMCRNLSKSTESNIVNGKGCVCAGCETARYCCSDCQVAQWPWHKAICKAIKKQRRRHGRTD